MSAMPAQILHEIHEERIQRLEDKVDNLHSEMSSVQTSLDHHVEGIRSAMQQNFDRISEQVKDTHRSIDRLSTVVDSHGKRLDAVESEQKWVILVKRAALFIVGGATAVALQHFVGNFLK